jgi:hypothetical protein
MPASGLRQQETGRRLRCEHPVVARVLDGGEDARWRIPAVGLVSDRSKAAPATYGAALTLLVISRKVAVA